MELITAEIEKMAFGGAGFGHSGGKALFVPFSAPGDIAEIKVKVEKRSYLEGELVRLIRPSGMRTSPPCPVFGKCGGCNWQHLPYREQLQAKEEIFADILWRNGRVERERIEEIAPAPETFGYRSRVQLKLRLIRGELHMGFYRKGSHFVVDLPGGCALAHPRINLLLDDLRSVVARFREADKVPQIDVSVGEDERLELVVHYIGNRMDEAAEHFWKDIDSLGAAAIFLQTGRKSTLTEIGGREPEPLSYRLPDPYGLSSSGYMLRFSHGGFSQVNYRQNLLLVETVAEWATLKGGERVLDIYCGNGNFSIPLSGKASSILGVEGCPSSVESATRNCAANGVGNAFFQCSDAVHALERFISRGESFDLVLLDPPRTGAKEAAVLIPEVGAKRIVYVSCDPVTLARDLSILKRKGYEVIRVRPVDMFPQTYHIESVTLLEHGKSRKYEP